MATSGLSLNINKSFKDIEPLYSNLFNFNFFNKSDPSIFSIIQGLNENIIDYSLNKDKLVLNFYFNTNTPNILTEVQKIKNGSLVLHDKINETQVNINLKIDFTNFKLKGSYDKESECQKIKVIFKVIEISNG